MPKHIVTEVDYSGASGSQAVSAAAFIPGIAGCIKDSSGTKVQVLEDIGKIIYCESVEVFEEHFGVMPFSWEVTVESVTSTVYDKSWIMAHQLLEIGMPIYYVAYATEVAVKTALESTTAGNILEQLTDKALYDVRFLTAGAYPTAVANKNLIAASAARGDGCAVLDCLESITEIVDQGAADESSVFGWFNKTIMGSISDQTTGKYAAGFTPWCYVPSSANIANAQMSQSEKETFTMPASFIYLGTFALASRTNREWFATAGATRGFAPFAYTPVIKIGEAINKVIQTRETGLVSVNPIEYVRPYGTVIWGNRTLLPAFSGAVIEGGLKFTNFLNVRQVISTLKKVIYNAERKLTFDPNDDLLWQAFCAEVQPTLDTMKSGRGITGSRIIKVASKAKAECRGKIRIVPIEAVEDFYLEVAISDSVDVAE